MDSEEINIWGKKERIEKPQGERRTFVLFLFFTLIIRVSSGFH